MPGLFSRSAPEWEAYLRIELVQPDGLGGQWFYELSGRAPDGTTYKELSRKGYDNRLYARKAGEIMAGRVLGDARKRGIVWARLDAPPVPPRTAWREWMAVTVHQPDGPGGLWFFHLTWHSGDGTLNTEVGPEGYKHESAARETGENLAAHLYDLLVARGSLPAT